MIIPLDQIIKDIITVSHSGLVNLSLPRPSASRAGAFWLSAKGASDDTVTLGIKIILN